VYADADVYILDDPLSAVDAHVGSAIFQQCVCSLLAGKTRILVTHGLQYIASANAILVMADGRIVERGTYGELVGQKKGPMLCSLMATFETETVATLTNAQASASSTASSSVASPKGPTAAAAATSPKAVGPAAAGTAPEPMALDPQAAAAALAAAKKKIAPPPGSIATLAKGKQTTTENRERGNVKLSVYGSYIQAVGGWVVTIPLLGLFVLFQAASMGTSAWLSQWESIISTSDVTTGDNMKYLGIYAGISVGSLVILVVQRFCVATAGIAASRRLHDDLIRRVLHTPISFMDTTPLGRVLNRCAQDVYVVDEQLPTTFSSFLGTFLQVLGTVVLIGAVTPYFLLGVIPLAAFYIYTQRYYVTTSRELQRLDSISRSPIYANFSETLAGTITIRAFGEQARFTARNAKLLDTNQAAYFTNTSANRWLAVRLETVRIAHINWFIPGVICCLSQVGALITTAAALFAVINRNAGVDFPALAGLSISTALSVTAVLNWMVRMSSDAETQVVSVERIKEYSELPVEPELPMSGEVIRPPPSWPQEGRVIIRDLKLKYRATTPYVLHGISAEFRPHEHVGLAGRTGAGKSSLISAFFLMADVQEGDVIIDGINIAQVCAKDLVWLQGLIARVAADPVVYP
jgi:ABC-type multidrug transport system fused ATPase/permease subunit